MTVLFTWFFPLRHIFFNALSYKTGQYSDFTSLSLYAGDLIILIWLGYIVSRGTILRILSTWEWSLFILAAFSTLLPDNGLISLNIYALTRLFLLFVAYGTVKAHGLSISNMVMRVFLVFSGAQAALGTLQFWLQRSVGLNPLGEHILSPNLEGIAKIIVGGETYLRAYGTFPHPNPLSAFLLTGTLVALYFLFNAKQNKSRALYAGALLLHILGLTVTFSRAAFLGLAVTAAAYFGYRLIKRVNFRQAMAVGGTLAACIAISAALYWPYLQARNTTSDSASLERIFYAKVGWELIKANPIAGVGIGESVLHMQQYSPVTLEPWQHQPVHHYFLLTAAEMGILAAILLLYFFLKHLWGTVRLVPITQNSSGMPLAALLACLLLGYLVLMQFDHYFYTLQQTQLLLWLVLGLAAAEIKTPSRDGKGTLAASR